MGDSNNRNQDNGNDNNDIQEERFCSICHRSEKDTGTLVDIPGVCIFALTACRR